MQLKPILLAIWVCGLAAVCSAQDPSSKPALVLGGSDYSHLLPENDQGQAAASDVIQTSANDSNVYDSRLSDLEARYADLEAELHKSNKRGCCASRCCTQPGFIASVDLAILKPHLGNLAIGGATIGPNFQHVISPRVTLGYVNSNGFGGRVRYWHFDRDGNLGTGGTVSNIQADVADFEFTQSANIGHWYINGAGGIRVASFEFYQNDPLGNFTGGNLFSLDFDGVGPTLALQAMRRLGESDVSLVTNARGAMLFNDMTINVPSLGGSANIGDTEMLVGELGVGLQYDRVREGGTFFARLMYEAQTWQTGELFGLFGPDFGFVGPTVSFGLTR